MLNINLDDDWIGYMESATELYPPPSHSNGTDIVDKCDKCIPNTYEYEMVAIYSHVSAPSGEQMRKDPDVDGIVFRNRNPDHLMQRVEHNILIDICVNIFDIMERCPQYETEKYCNDRNSSKTIIFSL